MSSPATLVEELKSKGLVRSSQVESALRSVERHRFLPELSVEQAYRDEAVPIKWANGVPISGASAPAVVALMLEQLDLKPGHRVLEVGAGTGYNAALLATLVGPTGEVITVDIDEDAVAHARQCLAATGYDGVTVVHADGGFGFPPGAPYDRIVLTVGAPDVVPAWRDQLKPDGRLELPLWLRGFEALVTLEPSGDTLRGRGLTPVGFQRLRGHFAGSEGAVIIDPSTETMLVGHRRDHIDRKAVAEWLRGPGDPQPIDTDPIPTAAPAAAWLAMADDRFVALACGRPGAAQAGWLPFGRHRVALGMTDGDGLAFLVGSTEAAQEPSVHIQGYGASDDLSASLRAHLADWDAAGRPTLDEYGVVVHAGKVNAPTSTGSDVRIDGPHSVIVVSRR